MPNGPNLGNKAKAPCGLPCVPGVCIPLQVKNTFVHFEEKEELEIAPVAGKSAGGSRHRSRSNPPGCAASPSAGPGERAVEQWRAVVELHESELWYSRKVVATPGVAKLRLVQSPPVEVLHMLGGRTVFDGEGKCICTCIGVPDDVALDLKRCCDKLIQHSPAYKLAVELAEALGAKSLSVDDLMDEYAKKVMKVLLPAGREQAREHCQRVVDEIGSRLDTLGNFLARARSAVGEHYFEVKDGLVRVVAMPLTVKGCDILLPPWIADRCYLAQGLFQRGLLAAAEQLDREVRAGSRQRPEPRKHGKKQHFLDRVAECKPRKLGGIGKVDLEVGDIVVDDRAGGVRAA